MALVAVESLEAQMEDVPDDGAKRLLAGAIERLSDWALFYGKSNWTEATAPALVKTIIRGAVLRWYNNSDDLAQSRAGDELVAWHDRGLDAASANFTEGEITAIRELAGRTFDKRFGSVDLTGRGRGNDRSDIYVPTRNGNNPGDPFPFYAPLGKSRWGTLTEEVYGG